MLVKTNLHFHCKDDPADALTYTFEEALDVAAKHRFGILALTSHDKLIAPSEYAEMAAARGILFVAGIERTIEGKHVVVLNPPDESVERIDSLSSLVRYKQEHPEIFVIAPHPYFPDDSCLQGKLAVYREAFDAVEASWCFTKAIDFNRRAKAFAAEHKLPYVATSDTHELRYLDTSYTVVDIEEKTIEALFAALREKRFHNEQIPASLFGILVNRLRVGGARLWRDRGGRK